jgi:phosphoglycolate phosphatase-like HAD superfamily hydrolase
MGVWEPFGERISKHALFFEVRVKAVLFDLDGTIGNTLPLCIAAFRESIEPLAARALTDEEIVATFGPSEEGTIALLLPERQPEGLNQYLLRYEELHCRWPSPFEGIPQILTYLGEAGFRRSNYRQGKTKHRAHAEKLRAGRLL